MTISRRRELSQLGAELNEMKGIVPDDILEALKKKKLGIHLTFKDNLVLRINLILLTRRAARHRHRGAAGEERAGHGRVQRHPRAHRQVPRGQGRQSAGKYCIIGIGMCEVSIIF